jgi:hypothetical protein
MYLARHLTTAKNRHTSLHHQTRGRGKTEFTQTTITTTSTNSISKISILFPFGIVTRVLDKKAATANKKKRTRNRKRAREKKKVADVANQRQTLQQKRRAAFSYSHMTRRRSSSFHSDGVPIARS